jgi:uncharacterized lipoprotein YddW (UPF0748 family)
MCQECPRLSTLRRANYVTSMPFRLGRLAAAATMLAVADPRYKVAVQSPPPPEPAREFRAAWVTPLWDAGIRDWPSRIGLSPQDQRNELRALFDRAHALGLNAIVLHVRLAADAMYPTAFAPWSVYASGTSGKSPEPNYDPLLFAVEEAHARGLQLHAWFNPFRAMLPAFKGKAAKTHVTRAHPDWVRRYGTQTWIDPGEPAARALALDAVLDVVRRYDVDGVHIDDYFYPYREKRTVVRRVGRRRVRTARDIEFPDDKTWKRYGRASGFHDRASWRRANIDAFVEALYKGVKRIKPAVLVGISPFGIWRSGTPRGITGLDAYSEIYADSRRWLREGWVDYLAPQLYWTVDGAQDRFRVLDAWWREENIRGRHIWPGLYTSQTYAHEETWSAMEIPTQIALLRGPADGRYDPGHVHFRMGALLVNGEALGARLAASTYSVPAIVPPSAWLGDAIPAAPRAAMIGANGSSALTVRPGDSTSVRWWLVQTRGTDGAWAMALRRAGEGRLDVSAAHATEVAVRAVSPSGVLGPPTIVVP